jgi:hypothetical protein
MALAARYFNPVQKKLAVCHHGSSVLTKWRLSLSMFSSGQNELPDPSEESSSTILAQVHDSCDAAAAP